jgi:1-acyl-sn-glycerol-3-phosphate acyltransferase
LLYRCLKIMARLALLIFCRKLVINKPSILRSKGPLLLACNHPNSFLDAVILDVLFEQPVWSLARGDAFKGKLISRVLAALKILPVYRTSEGVENLAENYKTFDACIQLFKQNGIILIFSEGKCINEWHLRQLKKGTARLSIKAWEENIPLRVLPVGINYSSFKRFGKNIFLNFGEIISKDDLNFKEADGIKNQAFNNLLQQQLEQLVLEIPKMDKEKQSALLEIKPSLLQKIVLAIPAAIGWLVHMPLFLPVKKIIWEKTLDNDHYDSIMTGILLLAYPIYLLLIISLLWIFTGNAWALSLLFLLPFTAWSFAQLKPQLDNY